VAKEKVGAIGAPVVREKAKDLGMTDITITILYGLIVDLMMIGIQVVLTIGNQMVPVREATVVY